jgi:hypothetical protein
MARYSLTSQSATTGSGSADAATITGCVFFLGGNAALMQLKINEVASGGEAASGAVQVLALARDTTNAATPTAGTARNNLMDVTATAPGTVAIFGQAATTLPTRGAAHLIQHSYNAFGGLARWQARQGEEITVATATAPNSEVSYSSVSGGGQATAPVSATCIYELV